MQRESIICPLTPSVDDVGVRTLITQRYERHLWTVLHVGSDYTVKSVSRHERLNRDTEADFHRGTFRQRTRRQYVALSRH